MHSSFFMYNWMLYGFRENPRVQWLINTTTIVYFEFIFRGRTILGLHNKCNFVCLEYFFYTVQNVYKIVCVFLYYNRTRRFNTATILSHQCASTTVAHP